MLGELQRGRGRAGASRVIVRTVGAATRAAGAVFLFTLSQLITPAASLPLLNSHGTRKRPSQPLVAHCCIRLPPRHIDGYDGDLEITVEWYQRDISGGDERRIFKRWTRDPSTGDPAQM